MDSNICGFILKESLTGKRIVAITIGLVGILVLLNLSFSVFESSSLIVLLAAICFGIAHTGTKHLSTTNHPLTILFNMCLIQLPIALFLMGDNWKLPSLIQFFWLMSIALTALTAHYCITKALLYSDVTTVVTLDFIRLPLIYIIGIFFYSEQFEFSILGGSIIIILACIIR